MIDLSFRPAVQLRDILEAAYEDLCDRAERRSGEAVEVQERVPLEF